MKREDNKVIVLTGNNVYALEYEHKNGWNAEAFKERYSEVLERYDYIVGDWGYNQLRLRGFYRDGHPKATKDTSITCLVDYLNEYCNFGCAYFVLQKTDLKAATSGGLNSDDVGAGGETAQASETAAGASYASSGGMIMRWPPKERQGHPVRMPGVAAVARAAEEAERRGLHAQSHGGGSHAGDRRSAYNGRASADSSNGVRGVNRQTAADAERHKFHAPATFTQANSRSGGKQHGANRASRPSHHDRQAGGQPGKAGGRWRQTDAERMHEAGTFRAAESTEHKPESTRSGARWGGKNRKKNRFGAKPNRSDTSIKGSGSSGRPSGD